MCMLVEICWKYAIDFFSTLLALCVEILLLQLSTRRYDNPRHILWATIVCPSISNDPWPDPFITQLICEGLIFSRSFLKQNTLLIQKRRTFEDPDSNPESIVYVMDNNPKIIFRIMMGKQDFIFQSWCPQHQPSHWQCWISDGFLQPFCLQSSSTPQRKWCQANLWFPSN